MESRQQKGPEAEYVKMEEATGRGRICKKKIADRTVESNDNPEIQDRGEDIGNRWLPFGEVLMESEALVFDFKLTNNKQQKPSDTDEVLLLLLAYSQLKEILTNEDLIYIMINMIIRISVVLHLFVRS